MEHNTPVHMNIKKNERNQSAGKTVPGAWSFVNGHFRLLLSPARRPAGDVRAPRA
jgi:hypothetical protein